MEDIEVNFFLIMFSLNLFITTSIEVFANSLANLLQNQVIQAGLGGTKCLGNYFVVVAVT